jgi:hypothetical protein
MHFLKLGSGGVLWRVLGRLDLVLELEIDMAPKHSDLNITTLHRNALFEAREWGGSLGGWI